MVILHKRPDVKTLLNSHGYHQYGEEFCGPSDRRVEQYDTHYQVETKKQKIGIDMLHQPAHNNPKELLCSSDERVSNSVNGTDSSVESYDYPIVTEESFAEPEDFLHVREDSSSTKNYPILDKLDCSSDELDGSGSCSSSDQQENFDSSVVQILAIEDVCIMESNNKLSMGKDHLVHFISEDKNLESDSSKELVKKGLILEEEITNQTFSVGEAVVFQHRDRYIFHLVTKVHYNDKVYLNILSKVIQALN